ncbi:MAG: NAD(P)H-dependent oxidoreductase [Planctomycetes bacterium]|nr:NAD(P)H-dependent oxidoreductase [Planctomycetota bacterium]
MNISLILAHPDGRSFNHAIANTAAARLRANGHTASLHDLYAEKFDPLLFGPEFPAEATLPPTIRKHCYEIHAADGIVIVHPNWWGQPPAILKGWIDRVLRAGVAYRFLDGDKGEGVPVGLLNARAAIVFNTANTPSEREQQVFGDPLQLLWKNCIFDLCGAPAFHREMFTVVITSTYEQRCGWLKRVEEIIDRYFAADHV